MPNEAAMLKQIQESSEKGARARKEAQRVAAPAIERFVDQRRPIRQTPLGVGTSPLKAKKKAEALAKAEAARAAKAAKKATKSEES